MTERIQDAFYSRSVGHAGISGLISDRLYPMRLPEEATLPAVRFQQIGDALPLLCHDDAHSGNFDDTGALAQTRWQIDCYAETLTEAQLIGDEFVRCWHGYRDTITNVRIDAGIKINRTDDYDPDLNLDYHRVELFIWARDKLTG